MRLPGVDLTLCSMKPINFEEKLIGFESYPHESPASDLITQELLGDIDRSKSCVRILIGWCVSIPRNVVLTRHLAARGTRLPDLGIYKPGTHSKVTCFAITREGDIVVESERAPTFVSIPFCDSRIPDCCW
jgi:hypothetical protein